MSEYEPGVTAPPFHVWCRSVTVPYFEDNFTGERAARGADGETYYVPDDMTYKEWASEYINDAKHVQYGHITNDAEQYERYKSVLKEISPNSLEKFKEIKYNDSEKWKTLKYQYRTVNRYEVDGDVPVDTIVELDNVAWYTKKYGFDSTGIDDESILDDIERLKTKTNTASMLFEDTVYYTNSAFGELGEHDLSLYIGKYPAVPLQSNRKFTVKKAYKNDKIPREYDTEAKFLEFVATKKQPDDVFTVTILSEKHICASCQGVVDQFKEMFPNATVNIISGKRGYNKNRLGLDTYLHRKEVE